MSQTLIIRHRGELEFQVVRGGDGKEGDKATLTAPDAVSTRGRPDSNLLQDVRWYLEQFLDYPFTPNTEIAARILDALNGWGKELFNGLFVGQALLWYDRARNEGLEHLTVKIASDDPRILAWPWEALCDPDGAYLAHSCRIERQLSELHDPLPLPEGLPEGRINILLVIARPLGDRDVGYHALSRPLLELLQEQPLPVRVEVLRPPTFDTLERRLEQRPGFYHIVHFDGHGGYGPAGHSGDPFEYRGSEGRIIFEDAEGGDDPITAGKLTQLLSEYRIPIMVLNACQSARIDESAADPFASVAAALLKAGIRSVVAMGYNLYVSGAQQFVPAFYQRLLQQGDVAEATRAGRRAMLKHDTRVCARGEHPLQDWLVPVLYQQAPLSLPVAGDQAPPATAPDTLPEEAREPGDYGFIGRERAILALERAVQNQPAAGLLVHGMAGVGKTALAKGYLRWLQQTCGLATEAGAEQHPDSGFAGVFWFGFDDIRSASFVINRLVEGVFGHDATASPIEQTLPALIKALRRHPILIVWDNFESAAGIEGSEVTPLLTDDDRQLLKDFLKQLRGGRSKVLITSRAPETWLAPTEVCRLPLGGLQGEECWEYCNAVVRDLGLRPDRNDPHFKALIDELDGHPLAMRAVLLRLAEVPARQLLTELKQAFAGAEGDESTRKIYAALGLLDRGLPEQYAPVLQLIGLHRRFVHIDYLEQMAKGTDFPTPIERATLNQCFTTLESGGLLQHQGQGIYRMHPALGGFLARRHAADIDNKRGFVDYMGRFADQLTPKEWHEQRFDITLHGASFHHALALAKELGMDNHTAALTQALAAFAQNRRDFAGAAQLFAALAEHLITTNNPEGQAAAYHQLGIIAQEQRDFTTAEAWYKKSLAIKEKQGNDHGAASTYHQLGIIAREQRDFQGAGAWYLKAISLFGKANDSHNLGIATRNFGRNLQAADEATQAILRQRWQEAGLDQAITLDDLLRQLEKSTYPGK